MFNKIWYPKEELYAVAHLLIIFFNLPFIILIFVFSVSFEVLVSILFLLFVTGKVIRIRGALTLKLDPTDQRNKLEKEENRKGVITAISIIFGFFVLITAMFIPRKFLPYLPAIAGMYYMFIMGAQINRFRSALIFLTALTTAVCVVTAYFSLKMALGIAAIMIVFLWPFIIEFAIENERYLKGDLAGKRPVLEVSVKKALE